MNLRIWLAALIALLATLVAPLVLNAQPSSKLDSLNAVLVTTTEELARARLLNLIAQEHYLCSKGDTALSLSQEALRISKKLDYKEGIANAWNVIGNVHLARGEMQKSINAHLASQKIWEELKATDFA